jgi:serine/threonine protein kinase
LSDIGRLFAGRYRIDRELWQAPHLQSLLVTDLRNGRPCVLRRLFAARATPTDVRRFEAQSAILAKLDHPGLPRFIDRFAEGESRDRVLVTSYHPGESLERLMAKGRPLTEPQALALLRRIVPVLTYLHGFDPPLVHRAIKATGIVVGPDGRPCLTDIDFVVPELEAPTAEQAPPGPDKSALAAPEIYAGVAVPASDIYALGLATLRGMTSEDPAELLREGAKQRLRDALRVSEAFAVVLAQMLDPSLERRYPDAQALEADLAKLAGARVAAAQQPAQAAEEPRTRRSPRPLVLAGLVLALMVLAAVAVRLRRAAPPESGLLSTPAEVRQERTADSKPQPEAPPPAPPAEGRQAPPSEASQSPAPAVAPQAAGEPEPALDSSPAPGPPPTEPPAAPPPDSVVAEGRLLFDGKPFASAAAPAPVFWFRNVGTKTIERPQVDYAEGSFRIRGLAPGRYSISVRIDLDPSNPNIYPGDLSAWAEATLEAGHPAALELTLRKLIRLRQPVDNGGVIPGWDVPCGAGNATPAQAVFAWEPVDPAASYDVRVERLVCDRGYASAGVAFSQSTTDTWVKVDLPPSRAGECYSLRLTAHKEGRTVGILATHGKTGLGWDYRFSVAP